jgi:hypothetical protein
MATTIARAKNKVPMTLMPISERIAALCTVCSTAKVKAARIPLLYRQNRRVPTTHTHDLIKFGPEASTTAGYKSQTPLARKYRYIAG